jgi:hypothetical protein
VAVTSRVSGQSGEAVVGLPSNAAKASAAASPSSCNSLSSRTLQCQGAKWRRLRIPQDTHSNTISETLLLLTCPFRAVSPSIFSPGARAASAGWSNGLIRLWPPGVLIQGASQAPQSKPSPLILARTSSCYALKGFSVFNPVWLKSFSFLVAITSECRRAVAAIWLSRLGRRIPSRSAFVCNCPQTVATEVL